MPFHKRIAELSILLGVQAVETLTGCPRIRANRQTTRANEGASTQVAA